MADASVRKGESLQMQAGLGVVTGEKRGADGAVLKSGAAKGEGVHSHDRRIFPVALAMRLC